MKKQRTSKTASTKTVTPKAQVTRCFCCGDNVTQEVKGKWYCADAECQKQKTPQERWKDIETILRRNYENVDLQTVKATFAIVVSHRITEYSPSWLMSIAPPGSLKTAVLDAINDLPSVHCIDEVTPRTFISGKVDEPGEKRTAPASLLRRIGDEGILSMPDFSTVLSMEPHSRSQVLSQMRRIYDGQLRREFGTDENMEERKWRGRITTIVAVTPAVDNHHKFFTDLGDRFLTNSSPILATDSFASAGSGLAEIEPLNVHYIRTCKTKRTCGVLCIACCIP